jgi:hypothetical protein
MPQGPCPLVRTGPSYRGREISEFYLLIAGVLANYLRANMQQHRLSDLALLSVEKEVISSLNIDALITTFGETKSRGAHVSKVSK